MRSVRIAVILGVALAILLYAGTNYLLRSEAQGTPSVPEITEFDVNSFPPSGLPAESILQLQERVRRTPRSATNHALLGHQYLLQARETGNVSDFARAQAALERSLSLLPGYAPARTGLGTAHFAQHNFRESLRLAELVFREDPENRDALALLGDSQLALGNYAEAAEAYQSLIARGPTPPVLARVSHWRELQGDPVEARRLMSRATTEVIEAGLSRTDAAWYLIRLGDLYFGQGQLTESQRLFEAALRLHPGSSLALARVGRVTAAQGDFVEALSLYEQAVAIQPQPSTLSELGDLYFEVGRREEARIAHQTVEVIGQLTALDQQIYNRELALFYADHDLHLDRALELTQAEIEARQDVYGYDALAWSLYKKGRLTEAMQAIQRALQLGTQDAAMHYHAGMIYAAQGEPEQARSYLTRALEINPHFSLRQTEVARDKLAELNRSATAHTPNAEVLP